MFPGPWLAAPHHASAQSVAEREIERSLAAVRKAFAKYPSPTLRDNLDCVYIIRDLQFSGIFAGGTNSTDRVYIAVGSEAEGFTNQFIEATFHHEFSSILLRNFPRYFPESRWIATNPDDFKYQASGTDAIKAGKSSETYDAQLSKKGFLTEYSMWALEDDFNTIATSLFTGNKNLWREVDHHSPIETKVGIMIEFFHSVDHQFDHKFFRGLVTD